MLSYKDLERLNLLHQQRQLAFMVHCFTSDESKVYCHDDPLPDGFAPHLQRASDKRQALSFEIADKAFFVTPYVPVMRIFIIGAVHISQYLAPLIKQCGFEAVIVDPRHGFATAQRFQNTKLMRQWPVDFFSFHPMDAYDGLVALSHNPDIDDFALCHALVQKAFYIGALGSRKTHEKRRERLLALGVEEASLATIHAPIGLDICAQSPQEIAIAIIAQIIQSWHKVT